MMSVYLIEAITLEKGRSLAYYFCVGQEMKQNNASAVLRGLLWQTAEHHPDLMQHVLLHFDPPERGKAAVSSEETLWAMLGETCIHAQTQRLFCLVDGVMNVTEIRWTGSSANFPVFAMILLIRS
jgi:hypothetical protein